MRPSLLLPLLLAAACNDYEIKGTDELLNGNTSEGEPDIVVSPGVIAFGQVGVNSGTTAIETVTVTNEGTEALEIHNLSLEDESMLAVYTVSAIDSVLIAPGGSTTFTVTYEPETASTYNTRVLIDSNDPDEPQVGVNLTAEGLAPRIELTPTSYDYGTVYIGCENENPVTIRNSGNADLVISDFSYVTASIQDLGFDANEAVNGALPWTIVPGGEVEVSVAYAPLDDYEDIGYLAVTSNDPFQPEAQAHQVGNGVLYGENLDLFDQPIRGLTDIIFTVDWSCSMADDIARVQANFDVFIATLQTMDADYQVSVVTADDGCVDGPVAFINNEMSADEQQDYFDTMITGAYGGYTEMGFTILEAATTATNLGSGGCNEDMVRDDASLAMVGVTDEVEQSANPWSTYVSLFQSLKADPDDLVIHAIAGDYPSGCGGNEPGQGWYEASVATDGLFLSICATDWASHLEALAEGSAADLSSFELTEWPVPETIVVRVDGVTTTTGWTYNPTDRTVEFDESHVPEGGSTIEVEYALFGDCEG